MIWLFACTKGSVEVPDQTDDSTPAVVDSEIEDTGCLHTTYFPDEDGDGYGDQDLPTESCEPIVGAVIVGGDCDDEDAEIGPEADEECGDAVDNDCDGDVDEAEDGCEEAPAFARLDTSDAVAVVIGGADAGIGDHISVLDQDGDGEPELLIQDWSTGDDDDLAYLFRGPVSGTLMYRDAALSFGENAALIEAILVTDRDGDGLGDVVMADATSEEIYLLESDGWGAEDPVPPGPAWEARPDQDGGGFGQTMFTGGDFDGDGLDDLVVGAPEDDDGGSGAGAFYLFPGAWGYYDPTQKFIGDRTWDYAIGAEDGTFGDLDGDGYDDLIVPSARYSGGPLQGAVILYEGGPLAEAETHDTDRTRGIYGNLDDPLRWDVAVLGDLDGDDAEELALVTETGVVLIYSGFDVAGGDTLNHWVDDAAARIESRYAGEGGPWTQLVGDVIAADDGRLMVFGQWADADQDRQNSVFLFDAQTVYEAGTSRLADAESAWIGGFEGVDTIEGFGDQIAVGDADAQDGRGEVYLLSP
ncbi:MAG: hypothetical protein GY913_03110 [Proteobacteria bacterium]|nr:hypothetical protein [Pseudomonadota bacterium]MCP4915889.1 hypothetical protein [Pseudomonadota bacterium]